MSEPARSAVPLASVGIILLGLVPTLGGPDRPLHWLMTAGMVGFGVLLRLRHRLHRGEPPLRDVPPEVARKAGRAMLITVGVIALLVATLMAARWSLTPHVSALSIAMPLVALGWLTSIGLRVLRQGTRSEVEAQHADRPSRRPPPWDLPGGHGPNKATSSHASL